MINMTPQEKELLEELIFAEDVTCVKKQMGLNSVYQASSKEPVCVYAKDFDDNGSVDAILCRYIQGKEYPIHPRETLTGQIAKLRGVTQRYSDYGRMGIADLFPNGSMKDALVLKSKLLASVYLENTGSNNLNVRQLPVEAQFAPMYGVVAADVNEDGNLDILSVGNSYAAETLSGFYDAGIGNYLEGDGHGNFKPVSVVQSGFFVDGDAKGLAQLRMGNGQQLFLATQNRDSLKVFIRPLDSAFSKENWVQGNQLTHAAVIELKDGKKRKHEFYHGSGYLSSSSRTVLKDKTISTVTMQP